MNRAGAVYPRQKGFYMTWAQMNVDPNETARRQAVAVRINKLFDKRQAADPDTAKRIDREFRAIKAAESHWLKEAAFFLYI